MKCFINDRWKKQIENFFIYFSEYLSNAFFFFVCSSSDIPKLSTVRCIIKATRHWVEPITRRLILR